LFQRTETWLQNAKLSLLEAFLAVKHVTANLIDILEKSFNHDARRVILKAPA